MTKSTSNHPGGSNEGETATRQDSQSTNAGSQYILDMSASAAPEGQTSQLIPNSPNSSEQTLVEIKTGETDEVVNARMLQVFAQMLVKSGLARWSKIELKSVTYFALLLPVSKWDIVGSELLPHNPTTRELG